MTSPTTQSETLFAHAQTLMPGGVSSPVRAFKSVGGVPRFIDRGEGAYLVDADGNRMIDYVMSFGPLLLGHAPEAVTRAIADQAARGTSFGAPSPLESDLAEHIRSVYPSMERLRFVNSGTEGAMSAVRAARAFTRRDKVVKFDGHYHGHADLLLAKAGSGVATLGLPEVRVGMVPDVGGPAEPVSAPHPQCGARWCAGSLVPLGSMSTRTEDG